MYISSLIGYHAAKEEEVLIISPKSNHFPSISLFHYKIIIYIYHIYAHYCSIQAIDHSLWKINASLHRIICFLFLNLNKSGFNVHLLKLLHLHKVNLFTKWNHKSHE